MHMTYVIAISLLGMCPGKMYIYSSKTCIGIKIGIKVFTVALKQHNLKVNQRTTNRLYYSHTIQYSAAIKMN